MVGEEPRGVQLSTHLMQCQGANFLMALQTECKGLAIVDVLKDKYPCLRQLVREHGEDKVKNRVKVLLLWCNELLNLKNGLNPSLIDRLADVLIDEYPYYNLTMPDVKMMIERGASGRYSKDGMILVVNVATITTWATKYFEERMDVASQYTRTECNSKIALSVPRCCEKIGVVSMVKALRMKQNCQ